MGMLSPLLLLIVSGGGPFWKLSWIACIVARAAVVFVDLSISRAGGIDFVVEALNICSCVNL